MDRSPPTRGPRPRTVRIGLIGAGRVARERHIPGFLAIEGAELVGVCNRRRESSSRVAREFDIPRIFDNWEELVEDEAIDAVVIATWPYLHGPITLAALDAGKHVLVQSGMAMNAREAHRMLDRSRELPGLVAMVAPSPYGLAGERFVRSLLEGGVLGELREVHVTGFSAELAAPATPLDWRQVSRFSGFNMLDLGPLHEAASRWVPQVKRVFAYAHKHTPARRLAESGRKGKVGTPDSVQAIVGYDGGAVGTYRLDAAAAGAEERTIALHGSAGTLVYDLTRDELTVARPGDPGPVPLPIPDDLRGGWRAEADFLAAIRGERPVTHTPLVRGALTMHFLEGVARSSRHQEVVWLPLQEFSNPSL